MDMEIDDLFLEPPAPMSGGSLCVALDSEAKDLHESIKRAIGRNKTAELTRRAIKVAYKMALEKIAARGA